MKILKFKNSLKGSGIIVVILASIAFSIYAMSTYSEQEHFSILQQKYEADIRQEYEKNNENIEQFYDSVLINNQKI